MRFIFFLLLPFILFAADAKKTLKFDPEKGIIMTEEGESSSSKDKEFAPGMRQKKRIVIEEQVPLLGSHVVTEPASDTAFYSTGLRFFRSGDYAEALKYFENAWSKKEEPLYLFWKGACLRNLDRPAAMDSTFQLIVDRFPKCDVADDALFYLAAQAQKINDYQLANERLRNLIDSYPEGTSILGDIDYREEAKKRIRVMKIDIVSRLKMLDYGDKNPVELLKEFQKNSDLLITGQPNKRTVDLLVEKSDALEQNFTKKISDTQAVFNKRILYYGFTLFFLLINLLWGLRNIAAASDRMRRVELLSRETP